MPVLKLNTTEEKTEKVEETVNEDSEVQDGEEHVASPAETKETLAREKGWVPQTEFKGDADEWVDAEEFLARGPLYDAIHKANRKIKTLTETLDKFKDHYNKVENNAKQKALEELRRELKAASDERDIEKALEVKDKINELTQETKDEVRSTSTTPEFDTWVESNPWYNEDRVLRHAANGVGYELQAEHPDWSPNKIYAEVEKQIKKEFPEKFKPANKTMPTTVTTTTKRTSSTKPQGKSVPSYKQLPDDAKVNYRRLVKSDRNPSGPLTHEQFMKDYISAGGALETEG